MFKAENYAEKMLILGIGKPPKYYNIIYIWTLKFFIVIKIRHSRIDFFGFKDRISSLNSKMLDSWYSFIAELFPYFNLAS